MEPVRDKGVQHWVRHQLTAEDKDGLSDELGVLSREIRQLTSELESHKLRINKEVKDRAQRVTEIHLYFDQGFYLVKRLCDRVVDFEAGVYRFYDQHGLLVDEVEMNQAERQSARFA